MNRKTEAAMFGTLAAVAILALALAAYSAGMVSAGHSGPSGVSPGDPTVCG